MDNTAMGDAEAQSFAATLTSMARSMKFLAARCPLSRNSAPSSASKQSARMPSAHPSRCLADHWASRPSAR